jgi:hypothetical protein
MKINKNIIAVMMLTLINVSWGTELSSWIYTEGGNRYAVQEFRSESDGLTVNYLKGYEIRLEHQGRSDATLLRWIPLRYVASPTSVTNITRELKVKATPLFHLSPPLIGLSYPETGDFILIVLAGLKEEHKAPVSARVTREHIGESLIKRMFHYIIPPELFREVGKVLDPSYPIFKSPEDIYISYGENTVIMHKDGHRICISSDISGEFFTTDTDWSVTRTELDLFERLFANRLQEEEPPTFTPADIAKACLIYNEDYIDRAPTINIDETGCFVVISSGSGYKIEVNLAKLSLTNEDVYRGIKEIELHHQDLLIHLITNPSKGAMNLLRSVLIDPSIRVSTGDLQTVDPRKKVKT